MTIQVGTLQSVPIREVWRDEARDLTPWLAENPSLLEDALGLELELEGQEVAVGPFSADLLFRDISSNQLVVVENLINPTDHDHLGKVITYAAGLGAHHVVLLAERFRPEHRSALTWLNSISDDDHCFFGLSLEVWKIEDSSAPRLRLEVQPDDWTRTVRSSASHAMTDHQQACVDFWAEFLPAFHEAHPGWSKATKPQKATWMNFPSGRSGIAFVGCFTRRDGNPAVRGPSCTLMSGTKKRTRLCLMSCSAGEKRSKKPLERLWGGNGLTIEGVPSVPLLSGRSCGDRRAALVRDSTLAC